MTRRKTPRVYRDPDPGPSKAERYKLPKGWNPLAEYQKANVAGRAPSLGEAVQESAVRSSCRCRNCIARRGAA
ncbi:hypothetical protein [Kitasatospora griseola]|uniref:hypothetical protein n=1 Tax=Kitasatospora griseola TaxID=2064 RepID=UPI0016712072|nr:hypothetical protein [Kitasatospora griseola]GGQ68066.1 hypothetical protein GCM10010195_24680 [Kitasatospora griseola]